MVFANNIAAKAVLLLLWFVSSTESADPSCTFIQYLFYGNTYYIYNPDYPNNYQGQQSCSWTLKSDYKINLTCTEFNLPWSIGCVGDQLVVQTNDGNSNNYCGSGTFNIVSNSNTMVINLNAPYWTNGGKFLCEVKAIPNPKETTNCNCGWKNPTRIVGGNVTGVNEYPMMAGLVDSLEKIIFCGSTIINQQYVVTAGHCLMNREISETGVVVGEHDVRTNNETNATILYRIAEVIIHPDYIFGEDLNDIAVVKIDGVIPYSSKVGPACLPFQHALDSFAGSYIDILGWGLTEFSGAPSDVLLKARLSVLTNLNCSNVYGNLMPQQLCTYAPGKDSCQMDSGGPVLWQNPTTRNLVLVGVITGGRGCGQTAGLNTRVGPYVDWIVNVTQGASYCIIE